MANLIYPKAFERAATTGLNFVAGTIKVVLLTSAYTYSASHEFLSDISGGAIVATSSALSSKTDTGGVLDAADLTFTALTGSPIVSLVIYEDTGSSATSGLLIFIDGFSTFTPNGVDDLHVKWSSSGIAQI